MASTNNRYSDDFSKESSDLIKNMKKLRYFIKKVVTNQAPKGSDQEAEKGVVFVNFRKINMIFFHVFHQ